MDELADLPRLGSEPLDGGWAALLGEQQEQQQEGQQQQGGDSGLGAAVDEAGEDEASTEQYTGWGGGSKRQRVGDRQGRAFSASCYRPPTSPPKKGHTG